MKDIGLLFCSSRDTNRHAQDANLGVSRYDTTLDTPIAVEHQLEKLYLSLNSFTFTNFFYNCNRSFHFCLGVAYHNAHQSIKTEVIEEYPCQEGYFDEIGFQNQFLEIVNTKGVTPYESHILLSSLLFTPLDSTSFFPTTFESLQYTERNGKFMLTRAAFSFSLLEAEVLSSSVPFLPFSFIIHLNEQSMDLYDELGLFRPGDKFVETSTKQKQIRVPLTYTVTSITVTGVKYFQYNYEETVYEFAYPANLRSVDYIDVNCNNVESTHFSSNREQLSLSKTIARIPVISHFGQTQTYIPQAPSYISIEQGILNSLRITLSDAKNEINMQKSTFLCELGISIQSMKDIANAEGQVDEMTYMPPVLAENRFTQDNLDFPQKQKLSQLQTNIYGENRQGKFARRK